ncbi:MAG: hypothetical protein OEY34_08820 [Cyclobacteriaceae bacterium]|nr:hypothetical protein [Cyclobacteriaceae bacterium]
MELYTASKGIFSQLRYVLQNISNDSFQAPLISLNNATIGQHFRHTIEFFTCLQHSYMADTINYDQRNHDKTIETDLQVALLELDKAEHFINQEPMDRELKLEGSYSIDKEDSYVINTNFFRELAYNIEHAIHHMAIIKIGLAEAVPGLELPAHFGVASSTVRYQASRS